MTRTSQKEWGLSQANFDELLAWLAPDREQAGKVYEEIRRRLIKLFAYRGSVFAEELADETINRVAKKVRDIKASYVGDPSLYFHGVARYVYLEHAKKPREQPPPELTVKSVEPQELEESDLEYECLEQCMRHLSPRNRELVLEYFQDDKRAKIEHRKELTQRLGITVNALRIQVHRACARLKKCMHECLEATRT